VTALASLLRRDRVLTAGGLAALTLLAWLYIWQGAGSGMSALDMTTFALFPHTQGEPMPDMIMPATSWLTVVAMWWIMMIAMMTPSASPVVLLYERVSRHAATHGSSGAVSSLFLVGGYFTAWLAFSIAATGLQYLLQRAGLISTMMLWSKSAWLSAAVLVGAGVYQLSPLKYACLRQCRGPIEFLTRHSRPGRAGAWIMGLQHGAWCVGCCWMLMALLFVGGVMNLVWIAILALLVLAEKVLPYGMTVSRIAGAVLIAWGVATLLER
jgi:predicted metal-binding membrane protein